MKKTLTVPIWLIIKKGEERRFSATHPLSDNWRVSLVAQGYQVFRVDVSMPPEWEDEMLTMNYGTSVEETLVPDKVEEEKPADALDD